MHDGVVRLIQNVRWVPVLRRNLLSESMFDDLNCQIITHNGIKDVIKHGSVLIRSVKRDGLYHLVGSPELNVSENTVKHGNLAYTKLWHSRLGHIGNHGLLHLFELDILEKHPSDLSFCEDCVFGKKTRHSFSNSTYVAEKPLEYVHSDLWGPAQVHIIGGRNYFLSLIDHFSRKVWIRLLKAKSDAFDSFKDWKVLVENQTGLKLKCLHTDNGLEFCNIEFSSFCREVNIVQCVDGVLCAELQVAFFGNICR